MILTQGDKPAVAPATSFDLLAELRALLARAEAASKGIRCPMGVAVSAAMQPSGDDAEPAEAAKPKVATKETRTWMLGKLAVYGDDLIKFARERLILLPEIEKLTDWPLDKVPVTKEGMAELVADIEKWRAGQDDQIPMSWPAATEPPPAKPSHGPNAGVLKAEGKLVSAEVKPGTTNGKKWIKYAIKVGEEWYSTFNKTVYDSAYPLDQQQVEVTYEYSGQFRTLKSIVGIQEIAP